MKVELPPGWRGCYGARDYIDLPDTAARQAEVAHFKLDPRDMRIDADFYEVVGDDAGVFGCMNLLACHDVCPKYLPLATQIAYVGRQMVEQGLAKA